MISFSGGVPPRRLVISVILCTLDHFADLGLIIDSGIATEWLGALTVTVLPS